MFRGFAFSGSAKGWLGQRGCFGACALLLMGTLGCVPLPTTTNTERTSSSLNYPRPVLAPLENAPSNITVSNSTFRPVNEWNPQQTAQDSRYNSSSNNSRTVKSTPTLSDRIQVTRRSGGQSAIGSLGSTIPLDQNSRPRQSDGMGGLESLRGDFPTVLQTRRQQLLDELSRFRDRDESSLGDGERLTKHRLQRQLIALHYLLDGEDLGYLEPLIESLSQSRNPARSHSLLVASFFESVDLEDRSTEILRRVSPATKVRNFRITSPILCQRIDGLANYRPVTRSEFRPGSLVKLYVEVFGLTNQSGRDGYRQKLQVEIHVEDRDGVIRGREVILTEGGPEPDPVVDSFLNLRYNLPREIPFGKARLIVNVSDSISTASSRQELQIRIEP